MTTIPAFDMDAEPPPPYHCSDDPLDTLFHGFALAFTAYETYIGTNKDEKAERDKQKVDLERVMKSFTETREIIASSDPGTQRNAIDRILLVGLDDKLRDVNEELQVLAVKEATYRETLEKLRKRVVREWKNVSRDVRSGVRIKVPKGALFLFEDTIMTVGDLEIIVGEWVDGNGNRTLSVL